MKNLKEPRTRRVWKFQCGDWVDVPKGAKPLRAGQQDMVPYVWMDIPDIFAEKEPRKFGVFGTGHTIPDFAEFVGGFTMENNGVYLEWHVFEVKD